MRYHLKTNCYGFLSGIGETENHPRLFRQGSHRRSIGKDPVGRIQSPDQRPFAPIRVRGRERTGKYRPAHIARSGKHRGHSANRAESRRRNDGQRRTRHVRRRAAQTTTDAHAKQLPRPAVLPAKGLSAVPPRRPKFAQLFRIGLGRCGKHPAGSDGGGAGMCFPDSHR